MSSVVMPEVAPRVQQMGEGILFNGQKFTRSFREYPAGFASSITSSHVPLRPKSIAGSDRGSTRLPAVRRGSVKEAASAAVDNSSDRTFFVTSVTWDADCCSDPSVPPKYFSTVCSAIGIAEIFQLYEFVLMPDHIHLLLAPKSTIALERTMQFIKGRYGPDSLSMPRHNG